MNHFIIFCCGHGVTMFNVCIFNNRWLLGWEVSLCQFVILLTDSQSHGTLCSESDEEAENAKIKTPPI